jgi:transcriptional regulator with AAA-type ATPase domain
MASEDVAGQETAGGPPFRWQAVFQGTSEPLFLLDRKRRLLFVNRAWERLADLSATEARGLPCRRPKPPSPGAPLEEALAHALTPPPEVLEGRTSRTRRLLPGRGPGPRWWDVEFFPLRQGGQTGGFLILGRIRLVPADGSTDAAPLPEKLVGLRQRVVQHYGFGHLLGTSAAMRRLAEQVRLASQVTAPVLLVGESGTGKRTLARIIHYQSAAYEGAFACVDCTRLPPQTVADLLFAERGPTPWPPGAVYLNEPAGLPRDLQLRVCQWLAEASAPPRLLAGSRIAPADAVQSGVLGEELAGVLGTLVFEVPPLRQRREDLPALVEAFLDRANSEGGPRVIGLTTAAWEVLRGYSWPGNLRELYAVLCSARTHTRGERIDANDLPASLRLAHTLDAIPARPAERLLPLDKLLEQAERRLIELALERTQGHKTRAAELLSIWRQRLVRRMEALHIADPEGSAKSEPSE